MAEFTLKAGSIQEVLAKWGFPRPANMIMIQPAYADKTWSRNIIVTFAPDAAASNSAIAECSQAALSQDEPSEDEPFRLCLRLAHPLCLPETRVANEVDIMTYLKRDTAACVQALIPRLYGFDATTDNALGQEYILMEYVRGERLDQVWAHLSTAVKHHFIHQIALVGQTLAKGVHSPGVGSSRLAGVGGLWTLYTEPYSVETNRISSKSFMLEHQANACPPPVIPVLGGPPSLTVASANPIGPFHSNVEFYAAQLMMALRAIGSDTGRFGTRMGGLFSPLLQFATSLRNSSHLSDKYKLKDDDYVLSHGDLHARHIMIDGETGQITGILNWSQAGLVGASSDPWNLSKLNDTRDFVAAKARKYQELETMEQRQALEHTTLANVVAKKYAQGWLELERKNTNASTTPLQLNKAFRAWVKATSKNVHDFNKESFSRRWKHKTVNTELHQLLTVEDRKTRDSRQELRRICENVRRRAPMEVLQQTKESEHQAAMRYISDTVFRYWKEILLGKKQNMPESMRMRLAKDLQSFGFVDNVDNVHGASSSSLNAYNDFYGSGSYFTTLPTLKATVERYFTSKGADWDTKTLRGMSLREHVERDFKDIDGGRGRH